MDNLREKLIDLVSDQADFLPWDIIENIADYLIDNGVTVQKWIPVTERLPKGFGTFLVTIDEVHGENRHSVDAADFDPFEKKWSTFNYFCAGYKITHWMPFPNRPRR